MTKKKIPYSPPPTPAYVTCHRCNETTMNRSGVLMSVDDHGAWTRHQHQPEGLKIGGSHYRSFTGIRDKRPLTRADFGS